MANFKLKTTYSLKKPIVFVFDHLTDIEKFVSVHPVIYKMDKKGLDSYLVHELLKIGFIPFSFTYPVTIEKHQEENIVIMRATVMKITKIEMKFELKSNNDYTIVEENIKFISPLPLKILMSNVFRKQHKLLFNNIENKII